MKVNRDFLSTAYLYSNLYTITGWNANDNYM